MGKLKLKHEQILNALERLNEALEDIEIATKEDDEKESNKSERKYRSYRDSLIKRFEFTVDQFWKYLKRYLEDETKQIVDIASPKPVVKLSVKVKLLSEEDGRMVLQMIDSRNMTSHIYKEEVAETICDGIAEQYKLMKKYIDILVPKSD